MKGDAEAGRFHSRVTQKGVLGAQIESPGATKYSGSSARETGKGFRIRTEHRNRIGVLDSLRW